MPKDTDTGSLPTLSITDCDRLWMQVLAARSARIKAQKCESDLIDRFAREALRTAELAKRTVHVIATVRENQAMDQPHFGHPSLVENIV